MQWINLQLQIFDLKISAGYWHQQRLFDYSKAIPKILIKHRRLVQTVRQLNQGGILFHSAIIRPPQVFEESFRRERPNRHQTSVLSCPKCEFDPNDFHFVDKRSQELQRRHWLVPSRDNSQILTQWVQSIAYESLRLQMGVQR